MNVGLAFVRWPESELQMNGNVDSYLLDKFSISSLKSDDWIVLCLKFVPAAPRKYFTLKNNCNVNDVQCFEALHSLQMH